MQIRRDMWASVGALVLVATAALLTWPGLDSFVPGGILIQARRNSEGLVFAALMITLVAPRRTPSNRPARGWLVVVGFGLLVTELGVSILDIPGWIATLNEAIVGAIIVAAYLFGTSRWRRPSVWFYLALAIIVLAGELPIAGWESSPVSGWIVSKAEAWGFAFLAALYFDFIRPWPVAPERRRVPPWLWLAGLVVVPIVFSVLNSHGVDSRAAVGPVESTLVWVQRITESFVALVIITVFDGASTRLGRHGTTEATPMSFIN